MKIKDLIAQLKLESPTKEVEIIVDAIAFMKKGVCNDQSKETLETI
jgi:hypothetical protein